MIIKQHKLKLFVLAVIFVFPIKSFSLEHAPRRKDKLELKEILFKWFDLSLKLTQNTPGYSPPVAARTLMYISAGTANVFGDSSLLVTLKRHNLNFISDYEFTDKQKAYLYNEVMEQLFRYFYTNMTPTNDRDIETLYYSIKKACALSKKEGEKVSFIATQISNDLIRFSKEDRADNCWNKNFPASYKINYCDSCWVPTYPGYVSALLPYWGENNMIIESNSTKTEDIACIPYSENDTSLLYQESRKIKILYDSLTTLQKDIAEHWDDSPGVSGTPAGHLYALGIDLASSHNMTTQDASRFFLSLGIALNDAIIECWKLKYRFNFIRPVTYIHKVISKDFQSVLITPPFPEFPSGHSFQAGAAKEVFSHFFGEQTEIIDSTNFGRTDITGQVFRYENFDAMSQEMSISRFYGGIHFLHTLNLSLYYGGKIGENTLLELSCVK